MTKLYRNVYMNIYSSYTTNKNINRFNSLSLEFLLNKLICVLILIPALFCIATCVSYYSMSIDHCL